MNLWHKNKRAWRTKASVAPYRSLRKFGMLLKIINLVPHSSLLLGVGFFYCHWLSILPSCSWGGWGVMGVLPTASRTLCHGHSDCRVCLGFFSPAWCYWWFLQPVGSTGPQGNFGSISGKGTLHSERQGMAKGCVCSHPLGFCVDLQVCAGGIAPGAFHQSLSRGTPCLAGCCPPVSPCCAALLFWYRRSVMMGELCVPLWGGLRSSKSSHCFRQLFCGVHAFTESQGAQLCQRKWGKRRKHGTVFSCIFLLLPECTGGWESHSLSAGWIHSGPKAEEQAPQCLWSAMGLACLTLLGVEDPGQSAAGLFGSSVSRDWAVLSVFIPWQINWLEHEMEFFLLTCPDGVVCVPLFPQVITVWMLLFIRVSSLQCTFMCKARKNCQKPQAFPDIDDHIGWVVI